MAAVAATLLLALYGAKMYRGSTLQGSLQSQQRIEQLQQQNSALNATLSQLNHSLASQQREIQNLRAELAAAAKTVESPRAEAARSSSESVQLPVELQNRDKQLEEARKEIEQINQLHAATKPLW